MGKSALSEMLSKKHGSSPPKDIAWGRLWVAAVESVLFGGFTALVSREMSGPIGQVGFP